MVQRQSSYGSTPTAFYLTQPAKRVNNGENGVRLFEVKKTGFEFLCSSFHDQTEPPSYRLFQNSILIIQVISMENDPSGVWMGFLMKELELF